MLSQEPWHWPRTLLDYRTWWHVTLSWPWWEWLVHRLQLMVYNIVCLTPARTWWQNIFLQQVCVTFIFPCFVWSTYSRGILNFFRSTNFLIEYQGYNNEMQKNCPCYSIDCTCILLFTMYYYLVILPGLYGMIGTLLGPLMHLGGPVVTRAAMYTGALISGLTLAAMTAPSEKYLHMSGPLMMGFCAVFAASIATAFFPPTGFFITNLMILNP